MFVKNNDIKPVQMAEGVERKVLGFGGKIMTVEVKFKTGGIAALHSHVHEQVSYIAKGRFEFVLGEDKEILSAGDSVYIPSNTLHKVTALEEGVVIDSFSPIREDFLK